MRIAFDGVLPEIVVGHVAEAKPAAEDKRPAPGKEDAPEDPVGHPQYERQLFRRPAIPQDISQADAPDEAEGPDDHDDPALSARVLQQELFFVGSLFRFVHTGTSIADAGPPVKKIIPGCLEHFNLVGF
jgi:hypothetical protein